MARKKVSIVFRVWPKTRSVREAFRKPFFVEALHDQFRIAGTFPNGITSLCAVPGNVPVSWNGWFLKEEDAVRVANRLNRMQAQRRISWNGDYPLVLR